MTCKICVAHYEDKLKLQGVSKKHLYIADSKNYKISTVSDHENSGEYIDAVRVIKSQKQKKQIGMALKEHTRKELKFTNVHALIKKNRPISERVHVTVRKIGTRVM
jgi:hypothetical protein